MANNATFQTSERKFTSCLGTVEFDLGGSSNPIHYKRSIVAHFTETTTITRGLTSCAADASQLEMRTYDFWYGGSTSGYTHVYFDYEYLRVVSECHRVNEAGFFEKTTVTTSCTDITVQNA